MLLWATATTTTATPRPSSTPLVWSKATSSDLPSCLLPLTDARGLSQELGTRHRAAIGISEQSDALVVVVSEETGTVSVTRNGEIYRYLRREDVVDMLQSAFVGNNHFTLKQMILEKLDKIRNKNEKEANDVKQIVKPGGKS